MSVVPARRRVRSARRPARHAWRLAAGIALLSFVGLAAGCSGSDDGAENADTVKRVGLMHVGTDHVPPSLDGMRNRLAELGWIEGENVELMWRNLEPELAGAQARAFVLDQVDVIVAFEDKSIEAAQRATRGAERNRIPIVFLHPSDPVRDGLVTTLRNPGGNLTGVFGARDEVDKQLETYELLVPRLHRLLTLADPTDKRTERLLPQLRKAAAGLPRPVELVVREATTEEDLRRIFRSLRPGDVDGAFLLSPSLRLNHSSLSIKLARRAGIPIQAHRKEWVEQGALFSYGIDLKLIGRAGARYVDSILRGTPPSELPVEEIPDIEFAVNLETAARLGFQVPEEMIIRADEAYP
jgi:putative tryptophan/tyrosine transport system substrate-binding protein